MFYKAEMKVEQFWKINDLCVPTVCALPEDFK